MAQLVSLFSVGGLARGHARRCSTRSRSGTGALGGGRRGEAERRLREERVGLAFGLRSGAAWNEELVLERYELLYEAGLVSEAARDLGRPARA